jgi:hypothetical protein
MAAAEEDLTPAKTILFVDDSANLKNMKQLTARRYNAPLCVLPELPDEEAGPRPPGLDQLSPEQQKDISVVIDTILNQLKWEGWSKKERRVLWTSLHVLLKLEHKLMVEMKDKVEKDEVEKDNRDPIENSRKPTYDDLD